jgi:hypothetical protein
MRSRSRLVAEATFTAFATALLVAAACAPGGSSSSTASAPAGDGAVAESGAATPPSETPASVSATPGSTSPEQAASAGATAPPSSSACLDLAVDITNDPPDGGVAMNNATTAGDAGSSDRLASILERVQQHRSRFRCCFDLWGRNNPGREVKVTLSLELDPTGKLAKASFKPDETEMVDAAVEGCMREVAERIDYPPSPSGKLTTYNHRFQFKARR